MTLTSAAINSRAYYIGPNDAAPEMIGPRISTAACQGPATTSPLDPSKGQDSQGSGPAPPERCRVQKTWPDCRRRQVTAELDADFTVQLDQPVGPLANQSKRSIA
jgi:hypothetical protein